MQRTPGSAGSPLTEPGHGRARRETVGGVVGVLLGFAICVVASKHPSMVDIPVPVWVVLLALGFSAGAGVLFGIIPAFKAAIVQPIDALRHE